LAVWLLNGRHAFGTVATCALLVAGLLVNDTQVPASGSFPVLAVGLSNQSWAASFAKAPVRHNDWSAPILSWTNEGHIPSTNRSFDQLNKNRVLP
jgi:hypothetical protein